MVFLGDGRGQFYSEWRQIYVLLEDGGLALYGVAAAHYTKGDEIWSFCKVVLY